MKKFARTLFLTAVLSLLFVCGAVCAEEEVAFTAENVSMETESSEIGFNAVSVCLSSEFIPSAVEGEIIFSLYDEDKKTLLDTKSFYRTQQDCWAKLEFSVPEYEIGAGFVLCLESGADSVTFCDVTASEHFLQTYSYPDQEGNLACQTEFYMQLNPSWSRKVFFSVPGIRNKQFFHYIIDEEVYVTEDLLSVLGITCKKDFEAEKPSFSLTGDNENVAVFYADDIYATFGGVGENLPYKAFVTDSMPFVPLFRVAEYFECDLSVVADDEYHKEINLSLAKKSDSYKNAAFVNEKGYASDTEYLIWVSKKDYTVSVFLGAQNNWKLIKTAKCAIGAPSTPTVEGVFKYHQYQTRWQYDGYYCGPIMRFYRGYALHSTLIRNNGNPYDNRVGARISHGCVRLRPDDINWLVEYIPINTTVAVTA